MGFGNFTSYDDDPVEVLKSALDTGFDPVKLRALREQRLAELDRVASPNLGANYGPARITSGATVADYNRLKGEIDDDPYTGQAAHDQTARTNTRLDEAASVMRPEIGDASKTTATRNAFGDFLSAQAKAKGTGLGAAEAESSPQAQYVANEESKRNIQRAEAMKGATFGDLGHGAPNPLPAKPTHLTPAEQDAADKAATVAQLGPQVMRMLEQQYPGIDKDPQKFGSMTDVLGSKVGGAIYRLGKTQTPSDDAINTMTGYLEATLPRMLASGRINQQQYNDLKLHVPQVGFSPGANYERIKMMLGTILPVVMNTMGNQPNQPGDPMADPNRGR